MSVERLDHTTVKVAGNQIPEHRKHCGLHDAHQDLAVTILVQAVHLDFSGHGRRQCLEVRHPGYGHRLSCPDRPPHGTGRQRLLTGQRHANRHPGPLVQVRTPTSLLGDGGHQSGHEVGHHNLHPVDCRNSGLLDHDVHLDVSVQRVVSADLGAESVLERSDDATSVGVVLRISRGEQHHIQRQTHPVATDLDVAFFKHVQQADLDPFGQIG